MKRKILVCVCLLVRALMVASTVPVGAKKPPKDPPPDDGNDPTGTLYYTYPDSGSNYVWSMDPDGSNKAKEHLHKGEYYSMSRSEHDGYWWYIGWKAVGGNNPDGSPRWELFAVREDGQNEVQLTDDPNMEVNRLSIRPTWGLSDDTVSWSGLIWELDASGNDVVKEAGIYTADITWTSDAVTGIGTISKMIESGYTSFGTDTIYAYMRETMDWSPDGKKITYMKWDVDDDVGKVFIYDIVNDVETELVRGDNPQWSPDGTYISFGQDRSILIIKPDGTDKTTLAKSSYKGPVLKTARYQYWSPDSKFLMYHIYTINYNKIGSSPTDIYIVDLEGNEVCLTKSLTSTDWKTPVGWR